MAVGGFTAFFVGKAVCFYQWGNGDIEVAVGQFGECHGGVEVVDEDLVEEGFFVVVHFAQYGVRIPEGEGFVYCFEDAVDAVLYAGLGEQVLLCCGFIVEVVIDYVIVCALHSAVEGEFLQFGFGFAARDNQNCNCKEQEYGFYK